MPTQYGGRKVTPPVKQDIWRQPVWGRFYRPSRIVSGVQVMYADSGAGTVTLAGSSTESTAHAATAAGTVTVAGTSTEVHGWSDTAAGTITLSGARSESQTHALSAAGTITLNRGAVSETFTGVGFSDNPAPTIEFTLSGTATQSATYNDSGSGTITVSGTRVESAVQAGSQSGTLTLSGSAIESQSHTYTDSGTGTVTLSYVSGTAYPGNFFPGQIYPGQTAVSTPSIDTHGRSGAGTITLSGTGLESYQNGSSIAYTDHGSGTTLISGAVDENFGTLDTGTGTITFYGTGHDSGLQPVAAHGLSLTGTTSSARRLVAADVAPRDLSEVPAAPAILTPA